MKLHDRDWLPAYAMAVLIAAGFMTDWPHEWTRAGLRSIRRNQVDGKKSFHGGYTDGTGVVGEAAAIFDRGRERRADGDV